MVFSIYYTAIFWGCFTCPDWLNLQQGSDRLWKWLLIMFMTVGFATGLFVLALGKRRLPWQLMANSSLFSAAVEHEVRLPSMKWVGRICRFAQERPIHRDPIWNSNQVIPHFSSTQWKDPLILEVQHSVRWRWEGPLHSATYCDHAILGVEGVLMASGIETITTSLTVQSKNESHTLIHIQCSIT